MYQSETPTIGSSSIAAILGLSKWAGPWDVWARLHGLSENFDNPAMARGRILEPAIAEFYAEEHGCTLREGPTIEEAPIIGPEPWMHARPDRFVLNKAERWLLEIKSTRMFDSSWGCRDTDQVPAYYAAQVVWQMAVCDEMRTDLAAFATITDEYRVFKIMRDEAVEKGIVDYARNWFERHITDGAPPEVDGSPACASSLLRRFPTSNRKYVSAGSGGTALANDLFNVRSKMAELQIEKGRIENLIKEKIGDNHGMAGVATWAQAKPSRRIDAKTLREKEPEIAAKYTVEGKATRRFNFIFEPQSEE